VTAPSLPIGALVVLLAASGASQLAAQADTSDARFWEHPIHVGAFVGVSFPVAQWRNSFESGDDGALSLAWAVTPVRSIWLEGQFNGQSQLMINTIQSGFQATGAGASIYSLTLNVVANAPDLLFGRVTPYVLGGGGAYHRHIELDDYAGDGRLQSLPRLLRRVRAVRRSDADAERARLGCRRWIPRAAQVLLGRRRDAVQRGGHSLPPHDVRASGSGDSLVKH